MPSYGLLVDAISWYTHLKPSHRGCHPMVHIVDAIPWTHSLIERNSPPREGFLFTMFPDQEPGWRGPPLKNHPKIDQFWGWFFRGGPLPPGSWFGNHPTKKASGEDWGFFRSSWCHPIVYAIMWRAVDAMLCTHGFYCCYTSGCHPMVHAWYT